MRVWPNIVNIMARGPRWPAQTALALLVTVGLAVPLRAGPYHGRPADILATLGKRIEAIRGYAVTIRYTKRSGGDLKRNVVRYESWGPSHTIRIRYLEGERAGVEALYTADQHKVQVRLPYLPVTLSLSPEELGGDRRIYETDLRSIIGQLRSPSWEVKDLTAAGALEWPAWALTMENRYLGQRVVLVVDQSQWLPLRIERFKSRTSDYEVWKFEDYRLYPTPETQNPRETYLWNNG